MKKKLKERSFFHEDSDVNFLFEKKEVISFPRFPNTSEVFQ